MTPTSYANHFSGSQCIFSGSSLPCFFPLRLIYFFCLLLNFKLLITSFSYMCPYQRKQWLGPILKKKQWLVGLCSGVPGICPRKQLGIKSSWSDCYYNIDLLKLKSVKKIIYSGELVLFRENGLQKIDHFNLPPAGVTKMGTYHVHKFRVHSSSTSPNKYR